MARIRGFEPIAAPGAHTLILGSMPSRKSLAEHRYYAHPRNSFWPVMRALLELPASDYPTLARTVAERGYAIWDVLQSCHRPGSLDADIQPDSIIVNDFRGFLRDQPDIRRIFFNGTTAERLFRRHVVPDLPDRHAAQLCRLPSTSPAHAALSFDQKLTAWRAILRDD